MSALKALIFDVDGTLADTERDGHRIAFNQAFAAAGLDWDWTVELYGELLAVTGGKERMRFYLDRYRAEDNAKISDETIAQLHKSKTDFYCRLLADGKIPLRPGVQRLIAAAQAANLRLAIATTTTPANVDALLSQTMPGDIFEVIGAGDIVPAKKPAPDIYTYVLERMKLDPAECLAFEDSENGIISATKAGLQTIVTINDYTKNHDFSGAKLVLSDLGEPGAPCQVLAGNSLPKGYLEIENLV
jgi:HAD superfamily hydrolase (TIGR01509 family)